MSQTFCICFLRDWGAVWRWLCRRWSEDPHRRKQKSFYLLIQIIWYNFWYHSSDYKFLEQASFSFGIYLSNLSIDFCLMIKSIMYIFFKSRLRKAIASFFSNIMQLRLGSFDPEPSWFPTLDLLSHQSWTIAIVQPCTGVRRLIKIFSSKNSMLFSFQLLNIFLVDDMD